MTIDLEKWHNELKIQRKHLVHWGIAEGEGLFTQSEPSEMSFIDTHSVHENSQ